jgi:hypothetical protein
MWKRTLLPVALVLLLGAPPTLRAGLYSTVKPPKGPYPVPKGGVKKIQPQAFSFEYLPELMAIGQNLRQVRKDNPANKILQKYVKNYLPLQDQYQARVKELENKPPEALTVEDRINLSYYLIRLNQPLEALGALKPAETRAGNFMVYANLGTAYQMAAEMSAKPGERRVNYLQARLALRQALRFWPARWPGWTSQQLAWFKKVEAKQADLVRLRVREKDPKYQDVDHLFPIEFVGKDGKYGPGRYQGKLGKDDVAIVQELLAWLPQDTRLFWLLGELLNARDLNRRDPKGEGDLHTAYKILDNCVWTRNLTPTNVPKLSKHLQALKKALKRVKPVTLRPPPPKAASPPAKDDAGSWLPDRGQLFLVGGLGALVLGLLTYWQIREIRRRRKRKTGAPHP